MNFEKPVNISIKILNEILNKRFGQLAVSTFILYILFLIIKKLVYKITSFFIRRNEEKKEIFEIYKKKIDYTTEKYFYKLFFGLLLACLITNFAMKNNYKFFAPIANYKVTVDNMKIIYLQDMVFIFVYLFIYMLACKKNYKIFIFDIFKYVKTVFFVYSLLCLFVFGGFDSLKQIAYKVILYICVKYTQEVEAYFSDLNNKDNI